MAKTRVSPITKTAPYWPHQTTNIYSVHITSISLINARLCVATNGLSYNDDDDTLDGRYRILPVFIGYGQHACDMRIGSRDLMRRHNFGIHLKHLTYNLLVLERKSRV